MNTKLNLTHENVLKMFRKHIAGKSVLLLTPLSDMTSRELSPDVLCNLSFTHEAFTKATNDSDVEVRQTEAGYNINTDVALITTKSLDIFDMCNTAFSSKDICLFFFHFCICRVWEVPSSSSCGVSADFILWGQVEKVSKNSGRGLHLH